MSYDKGSRKPWINMVTALCFILVLVVNFTPFLWGALTSLKPVSEILKYPPSLLGSRISMEHYSVVMRSSFLLATRNSIFYSIAAVVVGLLCANMAGYALARCRFFGKKAIFMVILSGIPLSLGSAAMVVPNYMFFSKLGLINHWFTLPLLYIAYNLPMAIWVMTGGIQGIPISIEEAAEIDGANKFYIIFRLIPRISLPSVACAALFIFIGAWNEFIVSSVLVNNTNLYPIQVSIYSYLGFFGREWGPLMAASTIGVIPILIVFSILGKMLITGLTAGSVKE
jgi:ABC-type glycerol-3-phosphate transport system permease component